MSLVPQEPSNLVDTYRLHIHPGSTFNHTQSGGTFNQVAGNVNYVTGNLNQSRGENGISLLQRNISGDALHNSEKRFPPPLCHPDTRTAVQNIIQFWAADNGYLAPSVMWLSGPAGAGKSAVAQSIAENWVTGNRLAGAFFFGRWRVGGSSGTRLIPTVAYQLALHDPSLRCSIGLAVEADPAICDKALEQQLQALIVGPISFLPTVPSTPYLVIIDGLDECDSKSIQSRIIKIMFEKSLPMKFLICSRPEPHIRETFDSLPDDMHFRRLVLDETLNPGRDILRYLRNCFSEIRKRRLPHQDASWPSKRDLDRLVHSASGQFIYVATVVKFVDDEFCHPVDQLSTVLSLSTTDTDTSPFADLDILYTHILSTNPNTSLMMRALGTYFAIPNPEDVATHCVGFLDCILSVRRGSVRFALRGLHSILFIPDADDHRIRVHHASLPDFLSNPARARRFHLSKREAHLDLTRHCFSIVMSSVQHPEQDLFLSVSPFCFFDFRREVTSLQIGLCAQALVQSLHFRPRAKLYDTSLPSMFPRHPFRHRVTAACGT
ncbi:hypothetical protein DFH09DRAFT_1029932 [Mycena vulgaris]|nr:hypothetical protein DFH09DRAFT_1029932 [Mycena vulgaris]